MTEWLRSLMLDVENKRIGVAQLEERAAETMEKLRSKVEADINCLNEKIYSNEKKLYIFDLEEFSFRIVHADTSATTEVRFVPQKELLEYHIKPFNQFNRFDALIDKQDQIAFFSGSGRIIFDMLSQMFIEPLVKDAHHLQR